MALFRKDLEGVEEATFEEFKQALKAELTEKVFKLSRLRRRFWDAISNGHYDFDRNAHLAETVETLKKADVLSLIDNYLLDEEHRHMVILEYGKKEGSEYSPAMEGWALYSPADFKRIPDHLPKQWKEYEELWFVCSNRQLVGRFFHILEQLQKRKEDEY